MSDPAVSLKVHVGDIKIFPSNGKTTQCSFGPKSLRKRPNTWHVLEGAYTTFSIRLWPFIRQPEKMPALTVAHSKRRCPRQKASNAIELLLTHADGWNRAKRERRERMGYSLSQYKQLHMHIIFLETLAEVSLYRKDMFSNLGELKPSVYATKQIAIKSTG